MNKKLLFLIISSLHLFSAYAQSKIEIFTSADYNWDEALNIPPGAANTVGNQILHFKATNKPYVADKEAKNFVQKYLLKAKKLSSDAEVLKAGSDAVSIDGFYIEAGVCTGKTINFIGALNPLKVIYGFDSFEGLPADWVRNDKVIKEATFAFKKPNSIPPILHNIVLYKGWFKDTLPYFRSEILKEKPIAFLHVDSDIYDSAKELFSILKDNIVPGTVIVFDELYNYPGYEQHEWKAFMEFLVEKNLKVKYIAFNQNHEQVAVKIVK